jgi:hypothetical protein
MLDPGMLAESKTPFYSEIKFPAAKPNAKSLECDRYDLPELESHLNGEGSFMDRYRVNSQTNADDSNNFILEEDYNYGRRVGGPEGRLGRNRYDSGQYKDRSNSGSVNLEDRTRDNSPSFFDTIIRARQSQDGN